MSSKQVSDTYRVLIKPSAWDELMKLSESLQDRVWRAIEGLETNPRPSGVTKLSGIDLYRVRVGDYRIIYEIQDTVLVVVVLKVGNRRDVYR